MCASVIYQPTYRATVQPQHTPRWVDNIYLFKSPQV